MVPFALLNHQQQSNGNNNQYAACLYYATNGGWDNTPKNETNDTGIGGWTQVTDNNDNSNNQNMTKGTFHADEGAAAADAFYSGLTRSLDTRADS